MRANTPVEVGRKVDAENEKKMKKERKLEQQRQSAEIDESRVKYHAALNEPKYGEAPTERLNNANLVRVLKGEAASSHDAPLIPLAANVDLALDLPKKLTALSKDQRGVFIRVILRQPDKRKKVSGAVSLTGMGSDDRHAWILKVINEQFGGLQLSGAMSTAGQAKLAKLAKLAKPAAAAAPSPLYTHLTGLLQESEELCSESEGEEAEIAAAEREVMALKRLVPVPQVLASPERLQNGGRSKSGRPQAP